MSIISALNWRYATRVFDTSRYLPSNDLNELIEAIRLTPSSLGLQPYQLFVVRDTQTRAALLPHSYGQTKIAESAALFVFAIDKNITDNTIDRYLDMICQQRECTRQDLAAFEAMCKNFVGWKSPTERIEWAKRQAYIALGNMLTVAASMGIDACPMEGFDSAGYDAVLDLDKHGLTASVIAPVGYRSKDDVGATLPKVRMPASEFVRVV